MSRNGKPPGFLGLLLDWFPDCQPDEHPSSQTVPTNRDLTLPMRNDAFNEHGKIIAQEKQKWGELCSAIKTIQQEFNKTRKEANPREQSFFSLEATKAGLLIQEEEERARVALKQSKKNEAQSITEGFQIIKP